MIDLRNETPIPFTNAGDYVPGGTHISTLHRWRKRGIKGIRLETCLVGGKRFTSVEALERFFESITALESQAPVPRLTPKHRQREIDQAVRRVDAELNRTQRKD